MVLQNKNILAIDDTGAIRTFLRIMLQAQGATFHEAGTATEGLQMARDTNPDLIVLDLGLPDRDGLEILPDLKRTSSSKKPIVIILSVRKEQATKDRAKQLGADAYLTKPFLVDELLDMMRSRLDATA